MLASWLGHYDVFILWSWKRQDYIRCWLLHLLHYVACVKMVTLKRSRLFHLVVVLRFAYLDWTYLMEFGAFDCMASFNHPLFPYLVEIIYC